MAPAASAGQLLARRGLCRAQFGIHAVEESFGRVSFQVSTHG